MRLLRGRASQYQWARQVPIVLNPGFGQLIRRTAPRTRADGRLIFPAPGTTEGTARTPFKRPHGEVRHEVSGTPVFTRRHRQKEPRAPLGCRDPVFAAVPVREPRRAARGPGGERVRQQADGWLRDRRGLPVRSAPERRRLGQQRQQRRRSRQWPHRRGPDRARPVGPRDRRVRQQPRLRLEVHLGICPVRRPTSATCTRSTAVSGGDQWAYIGIERESANGTVQYDLEFNKLGNKINGYGVSVPNRSVGDQLFTATVQGSGRGGRSTRRSSTGRGLPGARPRASPTRCSTDSPTSTPSRTRLPGPTRSAAPCPAISSPRWR